jgi:hypothetical protein
MLRQPKLRKKNVGKSVYRHTQAGGETYFRNVQDVSYDQVRRLFSAHIKSLVDQEAGSKRKTLTAGEQALRQPYRQACSGPFGCS